MPRCCIHRVTTARTCFAAIALVFLACTSSALAQNNNNNNNVSFNVTPAGVEIDTAGVLRLRQNDPRVTMARALAARQELPPDLKRKSPMRKVSLNRLEQAVAECVARGERPATTMLALAGLTRLEYVLFYPESGDIVIAGPAEGFTYDATERLVGIESGAPTLLLEDLVVALRAFPAEGQSANTIAVSIDPTQEGLARMQTALRQFGGTFNSDSEIPVIANVLRQSLGMQTVTVQGVSPNTHFAHVMTEADYRMKLIGIGLEAPTVPLITYVAKMSAVAVPANALIRWYFVPDYDAIATSEDGLAMQMVGHGVKLIGEDELVNTDGTRRNSTKSNPASKAFTSDFTKKFDAIASTNPIYAQLRNLIDMSIAAAYIQDRHFLDQAGWDLGVFADEELFSVERFPAPQQVETAVNAIKIGNRLVTPIGGGIAIEARKALEIERVKGDANGTIKAMHGKVSLQDIPATQWWWD
jgi:hypothetical protein